MKRILNLSALLGSITLAVAITACGKTSTTKAEKAEIIEWTVTVQKAAQFCDSLTGVNTDAHYTLADTASINQILLGIKPENLTLEWTIPSEDGTIWLVAYENGPLISEKVTITGVNSLPPHGENIQVTFKFPDTKKWEDITRNNIGKRLVVFVNGQLMNAPQVNTEITSGNCAVSIPADRIHEYLPIFDLEKLNQ